MTKSIFLIAFLGLTFIASCQTKKIIKSKIAATKYAGSYSYGTSAEKGRVGFIQVYPETDNTILFYIDLNAGPPSYSMGSLYGRLEIKNGTGIYYNDFGYSNGGCKLKFQFANKQLTIEAIEDECGFGHSVYADGVFTRISGKTDEYFEDNEMTKAYFEKTKPTDYYKQ